MHELTVHEHSTPQPSREKRESRRALPLISSLYVTQYLGTGFIYVGLVAILRKEGISLESLALVSLAGAAWAIKPLWAPIIDFFFRSHTSHYRTWLFILQPILALSGLSLVAIPEPAQNLGLLSILILIYAFVSATQDIAADGLTARAVDDSSRPLANGVAGAAQWFGNVLGGGLVVIIYDQIGWVAAMLTLTTLSLTPLLWLPRHLENVPTSPPPAFAQAYAALGGVFRKPGVIRWGLIVMPLYLGSIGSAYGLLSPMLTDAGWELSTLGAILGIALALPSAIAAIGMGSLITRFGKVRCVAVSGTLGILSIIALIFLVGGGASIVPTTITLVIYAAALAATGTVVYTVSMTLAREGSEGTDFTVFTAIATVSTYLLSSVLLYIAGSVGYINVLIFCAVMTVVGTIVALGYFSKEERRVA